MTPEEIAGIEPGDELAFKVEKVQPLESGGVIVTFEGANGLGDNSYLTPSVLAHATLTPAPEPLAVGETVMWKGKRWEVVEPPRTRDDGQDEVTLWNRRSGYDCAIASKCTRVQP